MSHTKDDLRELQSKSLEEWNDGDEVKRDEYRAKYKEKELNK